MVSIHAMSSESCLLLIPKGIRRAACGASVDFDQLRESCIAPVVEKLGHTLVHPNIDVPSLLLDAASLRRVVQANLCIADISLMDPVVLYLVGMRHTLRSGGTVLMVADALRTPLGDLQDSVCTYRLAADGGISDPVTVREGLTYRLHASTEGRKDSPVLSALDEDNVVQAADQAARESTLRCAFDAAQEHSDDRLSALIAFEDALMSESNPSIDLCYELFFAYRGLQAWAEMGALFHRLPEALRRLPNVREQRALALNRAGDPAQAESVLRELLNERGSSGEAHAVLGRLYKDQWEAASYGDQSTLALGLMDKAIEAYLDGFAADTRNPYAGVNAATLMEIREPPDARLSELLPVVIFAARQRVESGTSDYWDFATLLEAAVLANDQETASRVLVEALGACREGWKPKSTARNLRLIREARERRRERKQPWALEIEKALESKADT
jgi:tetratricopeptide (TPR) repeat protein